MGLIAYVKEEIHVMKERDPAFRTSVEALLYPGFKALLYYRFAHHLYKKEKYFFARWISQLAAKKTGIEIHPGAIIGKGCFIDHGNGIVIGETAVLADNVTLYQGVTLGGSGKQKGKRHPTLKNNVMVGAGTQVLGAITIGENCKIGAGSIVLQDIPDNCTAVGNPCKVVRHNNRS